MIPLIESKKDELFALCRRYGVQTLELFGSATGENFDPATSDLDFLVEYRDRPIDGSFRDHFALKFDLEALFGRELDLIESGAIRNPFLLRAIDKNRIVLYAA